jgi:hypothetical protein
LPGGTCTHWKAPPFHGARQNRTPKDREGVVKGLALRDRGDDREIAELVSRHTTPSDAGS